MVRKISSLALIVIMLFSIQAYATSEIKKIKTVNSQISSSEVWSTYNTLKIMQDKTYTEERKSAELNYFMAKGETEGAQLILTPSRAISSYDLIKTDLVNGTNKILSSSIEVFAQKYIKIVKETQSSFDKHDFPLGNYPDALVPISAIKSKNENKIIADQNQGIYVNIKTSKDTVSGTYTGTFKLKMNDEEKDIPVSVVVNDVDISKTHAQTDFYLYRDWLIQGELDNTIETYNKYVDFLSEYRISTTDVGVEDPFDDDGYVAKIEQMYDDPNIGGYNLNSPTYYRLEPSISEADGTQYLMDYNYPVLERRLKAIAKRSEESGKDLFSKMHIYLISADEPQYTNRYGSAKYLTLKLQETFLKVANELTFNVVDKENLINIPIVITTPSLPNREAYDEVIDTFCPEIDFFQYSYQRDLYDELANDSNDIKWMYTAWVPFYPMPSYHIDTELLGARVLSWMQYDYNIVGNLYWSTSAYVVAQGMGTPNMPRDPYNDPISFLGANANGDGYLTYPGKPYGLNKPVSSLRLEAIRDGIEDYELMYVLGEKLEEYNTLKGTNYTVQSYLRNTLQNLYYGTIASFDESEFEIAKKELTSSILLLDSEMKGLLSVSNMDYKTSTAIVKIEKAEGVKVYNGNVEITDSNYTFNFSNNNSLTLTFKKGNESFTFTKFIAKTKKQATTFSSDISAWKVTKGLDNKTEHLKLTKQDGDLRLTQSAYIPNKFYESRMAIDLVNLFKTDSYKKLETLSFNITASKATSFDIVILGANATYRLDKFNLKAGKNEINLTNLDMLKFIKDNSCTMLIFKFDNLSKDSITYDFSDIFYTLKV